MCVTSRYIAEVMEVYFGMQPHAQCGCILAPGQHHAGEAQHESTLLAGTSCVYSAGVKKKKCIKRSQD